MGNGRSIYPSFTGNPFVDAGIAALCALNQRDDPQQISKEDLISSANYISNLYPHWQKLRNLFTQNCTPLQPSYKNNEIREMKYKAELEILLQKIVPASSSGSCAACGMREVNAPRIFREKSPLTGSGDLLNYFSFFELGFPICATCAFAVQFAPLYLISNDGRLFLAHSHNTRIMLNLAQDALTHIRGLAAAGANPTYYSPPFKFSRNDINECVVKLARYLISKSEAQTPPTTIRLYSFINSGQLNLLDFVDLRTEVFSFIERARLGELSRNLDELFDNANRNLYYRLVAGESIRYFFLQLKERKTIGGWELFELYLKEVERMEKERIEAIKRIGQRLYQYLKTNNFRKLKDIELADKYAEFRIELTRIQKEELIWEIDDEPLLFPHDKEGAILWRETQSVLLAFIYGQMHKDGINPKEV